MTSFLFNLFQIARAQAAVTPLPSDVTLEVLFARIIGWVFWAAGAAAVIFLIYGGIQYISSAGDQEKATTGRNTITYAIIGIIMVSLSLVIINWVQDLIGGGRPTPATIQVAPLQVNGTSNFPGWGNTPATAWPQNPPTGWPSNVVWPTSPNLWPSTQPNNWPSNNTWPTTAPASWPNSVRWPTTNPWQNNGSNGNPFDGPNNNSDGSADSQQIQGIIDGISGEANQTNNNTNTQYTKPSQLNPGIIDGGYVGTTNEETFVDPLTGEHLPPSESHSTNTVDYDTFDPMLPPM